LPPDRCCCSKRVFGDPAAEPDGTPESHSALTALGLSSQTDALAVHRDKSIRSGSATVSKETGHAPASLPEGRAESGTGL